MGQREWRTWAEEDWSTVQAPGDTGSCGASAPCHARPALAERSLCERPQIQGFRGLPPHPVISWEGSLGWGRPLKGAMAENAPYPTASQDQTAIPSVFRTAKTLSSEQSGGIEAVGSCLSWRSGCVQQHTRKGLHVWCRGVHVFIRSTFVCTCAMSICVCISHLGDSRGSDKYLWVQAGPSSSTRPENTKKPSTWCLQIQVSIFQLCPLCSGAWQTLLPLWASVSLTKS